MDNELLLGVFDREMQCEYKGRQYLVRDNGSICRLPKAGSRPSKLDNVWSFGTKNSENGYMFFASGIRIHQVVCTAFHGPEPQPHMVVDHIDTNRCNNRPENLRWLTRLENALNNDATRKKIIYLCGSVEAFIENPAILQAKALPPDVSWMKTVTKEEAAACKKHIDDWAKRDSKPQGAGKGLGEWIFSDKEIAEAREWNGSEGYREYKSWAQQKAEIEEENQRIYEEQYGLKQSLTPGALQFNWKVPSEFPLCPVEHSPTPLQDYLANIKEGKVFCKNDVYKSIAFKADISDDGKTLAVICTSEHVKGGEGFVLTTITYEEELFIHENQGSFFGEDGAEKYFTLALGREWTGGEVFDDLC